MTNHYHLLLQQGSASLSQAIHSILNRYSHWFNAKHQRHGHLFEDRFRAIHCRNDAYFVELLRYIHLNPVRAGLAVRPVDWTWSGHREILKPGPLVDRTFSLSFFGEKLESAILEYQCFLERETSFIPDESAWPSESIQRELILEMPFGGETKQTADQLASDVIARHRLSRDAFVGQRRIRSLTAARREFVSLCLKSGLKPKEIQDYLGCSPAYISKVAGLELS